MRTRRVSQIAYGLPGLRVSNDGARNMTKGYYVTLRRGKRVAWLLGPYKAHQRAIDAVPEAFAKAREIDPWCDFDAYGTASVEHDGPLPPGKINALLPHLVVDG